MAQEHASSEDARSEEALADFVRAERVRFVFIQSALPILFSPLAAGILSLAVRRDVSSSVLLPWSLGLVAIAIIRIALVRTYPASSPSAAQVSRWERAFVASIVLVDLWWGIGGLFLLVPGALAERGIVFCFLMMMAGGHAASYAAHPATVVLGVLSLVVPVTILFALQNDAFHGAMALAAVLYLLATLRSIRTLGYFFGRTHRLAHEVQRERDRAEKLARTDVLTELNNRRAFYELGEALMRHARRYQHPAALLMLDIDRFKSINDERGHAAGDAVIRGVADVIRREHRSTDIAGRLGGEEFAVLLPETSLEAASRIAERLREAVATHDVLHDGSPIRLTVSVGVTGVRNEEPLDQVIARADAALYEAKRAGRDRVVTGA